MRGIMGWLKLHPYYIDEKVKIVVKHLRTYPAPMLDAHAKAFVVAGSFRIEKQGCYLRSPDISTNIAGSFADAPTHSCALPAMDASVQMAAVPFARYSSRLSIPRDRTNALLNHESRVAVPAATRVRPLRTAELASTPSG